MNCKQVSLGHCLEFTKCDGFIWFQKHEKCLYQILSFSHNLYLIKMCKNSKVVYQVMSIFCDMELEIKNFWQIALKSDHCLLTDTKDFRPCINTLLDFHLHRKDAYLCCIMIEISFTYLTYSWYLCFSILHLKLNKDEKYRWLMQDDITILMRTP